MQPLLATDNIYCENNAFQTVTGLGLQTHSARLHFIKLAPGTISSTFQVLGTSLNWTWFRFKLYKCWGCYCGRVDVVNGRYCLSFVLCPSIRRLWLTVYIIERLNNWIVLDAIVKYTIQVENRFRKKYSWGIITYRSFSQVQFKETYRDTSQDI